MQISTEMKAAEIGSQLEFPPRFGIDIKSFRNPEVWRAVIVEFIATAMLVFLSISAVLACLQGGFASPKSVIAFVHVFILWLCIMAAGPASGGHLNPCITFTCMLTGFTSPVRSILYILAQIVGSIVGSWLVSAIVPSKLSQTFSLAACLLEPHTPITQDESLQAEMGITQAFVSEFCFSFALLFIAFMVVLDPKSFQVSGPILSPMIVGLTVGLMLFISMGFTGNDGYTGAGMNPARCIGPTVVLMGLKDSSISWNGRWVFWAGPFGAGLVVAMIYNIIPPHHTEVYRMKLDVFTQVRSSFRRRELLYNVDGNKI
ncbi:hypothetical protein O6H91_07G072600 [Diphasiastrum complanatum]|uniref:Uncharacterized protein n=1 Tax=Diphasiastrum complanatum TaxID=34168 RepID=A0ACC2D6H1_DIPCM|nr:hypothetical protein O6H91_07G072600 [Diphasiastrum complanatum]